MDSDPLELTTSDTRLKPEHPNVSMDTNQSIIEEGSHDVPYILFE